MQTDFQEITKRGAPAPYWPGLGWLALALTVALLFAHPFGEMWLRWFPAWPDAGRSLYDRIVGGESYYTHGPLVPFVSLLMIVMLLRHTSVPLGRSGLLGWAVLALSLLLVLGACLARVNFALAAAFICVLAALVLLLWGKTALRRLWFPLAFLLFMVPLPEVTLADLNFRLKILSAESGVQIASLLGVAVERNGPCVVLPGGKTLVIANVCNGLRTLISLLAFGSLYAYFCRLRGPWRLLLFAATIPVAVASNALRIVSLIVVADLWSEQAATGWWHDFSGMLIFVLAFLLMFALERAILALRAALGRPAKIQPLFAHQLRSIRDAHQLRILFQQGAAPRALAAAMLLLATALGARFLSQPVRATPDDRALQRIIPQIFTIDGVAWVGDGRSLSQRELTILEWPSYLYRRYHNSANDYTDFIFLFSLDNRKGIHPPDLCVEGFGQGITFKNRLDVRGIPGQLSVPCKELIVQAGATRLYMLYTYKCGSAYTDSFWRQQAAILLNGLFNRDAAGGLIRITMPLADDIEPARRRAREFLRQTIPRLDAGLSAAQSQSSLP